MIAIIGGLGIGWIAWLILTRDHNSLSWFFMQQSLPLGGSNVVNVILVDFRGFDTFGEITFWVLRLLVRYVSWMVCGFMVPV
jgi:multicomponent K+:H+ antiporter subunit A